MASIQSEQTAPILPSSGAGGGGGDTSGIHEASTKSNGFTHRGSTSSSASSGSTSVSSNDKEEHVADLYKELGESARRGSGYRSIGDGKETKSERNAQAGYWSTGFTILKNVVNAGFLSLPVALVYASLIPAIVVLVVSLIFNTYTFILMARSCHEEKVYSYRELWEVAFGDRFYGPFWIDMLMFLFTLGGLVVVLILIGDFGVFVQNFCPVDSLCANAVFQKILVTVVILLPLSLLRDLYHLRFSSAFGLACIFYTGIYISANTQVDFGIPEQKPEFLVIRLEITQAIALFNTAFACHYNAPRYFEEFKGHNVKKFSILSIVVYCIIALFYAWVAIVPYFRFGGNTQGNVLNNYPAEADGTFNGDGVVAARLGMLLSVCMTFPIIMSGLKFSVVRMLWPKDDQDPDAVFRIPLPSWCPACSSRENSKSGESNSNLPSERRSLSASVEKHDHLEHGNGNGGHGEHIARVDSYNEDSIHSEGRRYLKIPRFWPIVIVFLGVTLLLGILFTDISDVNTVRGSILGMFIMYMLPVGIYMRLGQLRGRKRSIFDILMCTVTFLFGLGTGVLGLLSLAGVV